MAKGIRWKGEGMTRAEKAAGITIAIGLVLWAVVSVVAYHTIAQSVGMAILGGLIFWCLVGAVVLLVGMLWLTLTDMFEDDGRP